MPILNMFKAAAPDPDLEPIPEDEDDEAEVDDAGENGAGDDNGW